MTSRRWSLSFAIAGTAAAAVLMVVLFVHSSLAVDAYAEGAWDIDSDSGELALFWFVACALGVVATLTSAMCRLSAALVLVAAALGFCGIVVTEGVHLYITGAGVEHGPWGSTALTAPRMFLLWSIAAVPWVVSAVLALQRLPTERPAFPGE